MLKKILVFISVTAMITLGLAAQASAYYEEESQTVTVDILDLFDTNNNGSISFGDSNDDGYKEAKNVTKYFSLAALDDLTSLSGTTATLTISYTNYDPSSADCDAYVAVNGSKLGNLADTSSNTQSWNINLSSLNFGSSNSVMMHTAYYDKWYGDHYENFNVTSWSLTYTTTVQVWHDNPVPVPSALFLLAPGLICLAGIRRRSNA